MPVAQVRRAVAWPTNCTAIWSWSPGDFLTGRTDPLEDCITSFAAALPDGRLGCNGNHEIYAAPKRRLPLYSAVLE